MSEAKKAEAHGVGFEANDYKNRVIHGMLVGTPTTASTQVTGAGATAFRVNIAAGILIVDGQVKEFAAQADYVLVNAASHLTSGQSRIYTIYAWRSQGDGVVRLGVAIGAAATTGSQVASTDAEIEANLASGTKWWRLAQVTGNRTADTTVTQAQDNTFRPSLVPSTIHFPTRA